MYSYDSVGNVYEFQPGEVVVLPKQIEAFEAIEHNEATLYGGAVGGGKSHWLRWALIYWLLKWAEQGFTNVRVGLFCETFKALTQRQINPSRVQFPSWLGTFNKADYTFTLDEKYGSGMIEYCNLDDPKKYASNEWAMAAFDELTRITKDVYDDIVWRIRWPGIEHSPIIAATNPGGPGHGFVYKLFVDPKTRIKSKWYPELGAKDDPEAWSKPYTFIQSLPRDNPLLPKSYWMKLDKLPTHRYNALVKGDWSVYEGQFLHLDEKVHFIAPFKIPESWPKFRSADHGWHNPTVWLWHAIDPATGIAYTYREHSFVGKTPTWHKKHVYLAGTAEHNGFGYDEKYLITVGDRRMFDTDGSVDRNKTPAEIYNLSDDEYGSFFLMSAENVANTSLTAWDALRGMLDFEYGYAETEGQQTIRVKREPMLKIFSTCFNTISSMQGLVYSDAKNGIKTELPAETNASAPGEGDDEAKAMLYFVMNCVRQPFDPVYGEDLDMYHPHRLALREADPYAGASIWATD